jgi:hypothetical protein
VFAVCYDVLFGLAARTEHNNDHTLVRFDVLLQAWTGLYPHLVSVKVCEQKSHVVFRDAVPLYTAKQTVALHWGLTVLSYYWWFIQVYSL